MLTLAATYTLLTTQYRLFTPDMNHFCMKNHDLCTYVHRELRGDLLVPSLS
jgi:hypothetical protein